MLLAWFVTRFEPVQWVIEIMFEGKDDIISKLLYLALTCSKCVAFWCGVLICGNIWISILASWLMLIYEKKIARFENKIEF